MNDPHAKGNLVMPNLDDPAEVERIVARLNELAARWEAWDAGREVREAQERERLAEVMKMTFGARQDVACTSCLLLF